MPRYARGSCAAAAGGPQSRNACALTASAAGAYQQQACLSNCSPAQQPLRSCRWAALWSSFNLPAPAAHVVFTVGVYGVMCCMSCMGCMQDNYFLDSASQINFFFEEKAFDEAGKLQQPKELSINKIGHAMHDLDPVFRWVG